MELEAAICEQSRCEHVQTSPTALFALELRASGLETWHDSVDSNYKNTNCAKLLCHCHYHCDLFSIAKQTLEAREQVKEECGFEVAPEKLQWVTQYVSAVGAGGSRHDMYYAEVDESMRVGKGGGLE